MLHWLKKLFQANYIKPRGILLFGSVQEVIQAHQVLKNRGFTSRLIAPPPKYRVGCDLAIEFDLIEQEAIESTIDKEGFIPYRVVSTKELLPDALRKSSITEINGYWMCKAGNMKITIDRQEHRVVNISGGGCPDIPYVAQQLYGVKIEEAKDPMNIGNSLCAYMLQVAFDALKNKVLKDNADSSRNSSL